MHRTAFPSRAAHSVSRLASPIAVAVMVAGTGGCAEPTTPAKAVSPTPIIIIGGLPVVFNAQLRVTSAPDWSQLLPVEGHFQLKIHDTGETGFLIDWQASIPGPECDATTSFGGGIYFIQDSEDMPSPEDALVRLLSIRKEGGCEFLEGAGGIDPEVVTRLIQDPDHFAAVFFLEDGMVLTGTLQLAGSDPAPSP